VDSITFGSFPRSANHFFERMLTIALKDYRLYSAGHSINALYTNKNVITTIRNPIECIPSWIVFTNDTRPNRCEKVLEWYCSYYSACQEIDLLVFPFNEITTKPLECINNAIIYYNLNPIKLTKLEYDLSTGFHSPTHNKNDFSKIIEEMTQAPKFNTALNLFNALNISRLN
jgi:hypothetical protein